MEQQLAPLLPDHQPQGLQVAPLVRLAAEAKNQAVVLAADPGGTWQVEHDPTPAAGASLAYAGHRQRLAGQGQLLSTTIQLKAERAEQFGHLHRHLIVEAALALGRHLQATTEPLEQQAAVAAAAAANPQLSLEQFQGQPQLFAPGGTGRLPLPAGLLGAAADDHHPAGGEAGIQVLAPVPAARLRRELEGRDRWQGGRRWRQGQGQPQQRTERGWHRRRLARLAMGGTLTLPSGLAESCLGQRCSDP